ncbi:MAG TPA: tyrosine-protein phosphatase [Candidatus Limadaptatus stercorigallinarum]|uniref:Tyrosine-protein phosphatase n=1 Tax=Candidatus Limadaptatus stercorigallinarum TaxID=2840845 RepID=A0A9D1HU97_9FIRM|nr:tyrosine-protein phosphatase [Christensenellales bacterium]HIU21445.1 tyrosine-protein phosphatase [Candidatus Limadaptatus stercorigallinarum]
MKDEREITFGNLRDLGGLPLPDGGKIRSGKLYRACRLKPRTEADKEVLAAMHLDCVVDLRIPREIKEKPDELPDGVEYVNASVFGDTKFQVLAPTLRSKLALLFCTDEQFDEILQGIRDSYEYMPYARHAYKELFDRLNAGKTVAFHCTAGKDRTGVAAMMIELALGRTREQAKEQYMLSNEKRAGKNSALMKALHKIPLRPGFYEVVEYSSRVHEELFDTAYNAIFSKYDTIYDFLAAEYGVSAENVADWKKYYTENAD